MSAPNSSALTNLTSPSFSVYDSPDFESYHTSPMFNGSDADIGADDPWYPLFPSTAHQSVEEHKVEANTSESPLGDSPLQPCEELELQDHLRKGRSQSRTSPTNKHSSISGVNSRKRDKPLPPIVVEDPNDAIAMKRARNTLAARKSRQKKMEKVEELEAKITLLEGERDYWKNMAQSYENQQ